MGIPKEELAVIAEIEAQLGEKIPRQEAFDSSWNAPRHFAVADGHITSLNLNRHQKEKKLTALPASLGRLQALQMLYLHNNQLTALPASLGRLQALQTLYLHNNQLTALPESLGRLQALQTLVLHNNQLTTLPASLGRLQALQTLYLSHNRLTTLPDWITDLPPEVVWKDEYVTKGINLYGNPLETPPVEIVKQGKEAIRNYFESLGAEKEDAPVRLYEAKLLIVGRGDVGKTVLTHRLAYDRIPKTESTKGIEVHHWIVPTQDTEKFRINIWDFGGQEIYHATHQFFLTKRSLYVFVWEVRTDDDQSQFGYWLNVIKLLSDEAPVIMVMNKCDVRIKAIDQSGIQRHFPNVIGFHQISAEQGLNTDALRAQIMEAIGSLDQVGKTLPRQWVEIRGKLEQRRDRNYMTYKDYRDLCCGEFGLTPDQAGHLADYYHDLGVILHFGDNPILKDIVFLNPEWATDAVYRLTDHRPFQEARGRFHFDQLKGVWGDYPEDKYAALLELMMKFELCFKLEGTREYIIPELLPAEDPTIGWDDDQGLSLEYGYEFMPAGIVTRFMVRQHDIIKDDLYWKNGVILEWGGAEAKIENPLYSDRLRINVCGVNRKGMMDVIRRDIEHIHKTLNDPQVTEQIPCHCEDCQKSSSPHRFSLENLRRRLKKNKQTVDCDISCKEFRIHELLGNIVEYVEINDGHEMKVFYINGDYLEKGDQMKNEGFTFLGGQQIFADKIKNVSYQPVEEFSAEEFSSLKQAVSELDTKSLETLLVYFKSMSNAPDDKARDSIVKKIKQFSQNHGLPVLHSLTASGLFQLATWYATSCFG